MTVQKLVFRPGINRETTSYGNEGGYFAGDKIRFRSGQPNNIGGWTPISNPALYTYNGVCRYLFNWSSLSNENLLAVGTNQLFYVEYSGQYNDITPAANSSTINANPFATTSGSLLVTVTDTAHGVTAGTWVTFSGATTVAGLNLNNSYEIISVIDGNTYTIIAGTAASSTTTGGGSAVVATYKINANGSVYTTGNGWGAGPWSRGGWGSGYTSGVGVAQQLRLWSASNYGQDLIFAPQNGPIYYWVKDTSSFAPAVTLASLANVATKATTTATFVGSSSTIVVASTTDISTGAVITGTNIAAGTYVTTAWNGGTTIPISTPTTGASTGNYSFSYSGLSVPYQTNQVLVSDASRFVFAFGANSYDPYNFTSTYNPMLVRWSDQSNAYEWVPAITNQSGEQVLSKGSYIVTARQTRQEILTWTDAALYSIQYVGPPYVWSTQLLMDNLSIISPNSAITINNVTYWMGRDKFFTYSGTVQTLPCSLRQFIFTNINLDQAQQVVAGGNEGYNEVWWLYPSSGSLVNDSYVIYNYTDQVWYYGTINRTFWLDSGLQKYPLAAFSIQTSYLATAIGASDTTLTLVNGSSYPSSGTVTINSEKITYTGISGNNLTGCTRGAAGTIAASHVQYSNVAYLVGNQVMYHEYGNDDNSTGVALPIYSYVMSSDFDIQDGDSFGFVWRMLPDITFIGSSASNPSVNMSLLPRENSGTNYTSAQNPAVIRTNTYPVEQYTGQVYTRIRGRQMALMISSNSLGASWQLGTPRMDIRPDGRR